MQWIDQFSGKPYRITTEGHATRHAAKVKNYEDIIEGYEFNPESKCADSAGMTYKQRTIGLLQRRHVAISRVR